MKRGRMRTILTHRHSASPDLRFPEPGPEMTLLVQDLIPRGKRCSSECHGHDLVEYSRPRGQILSGPLLGSRTDCQSPPQRRTGREAVSGLQSRSPGRDPV